MQAEPLTQSDRRRLHVGTPHSLRTYARRQVGLHSKLVNESIECGPVPSGYQRLWRIRDQLLQTWIASMGPSPQPTKTSFLITGRYYGITKARPSCSFNFSRFCQKLQVECT